MAGVPGDLKGRSFTRVGAWSTKELSTLLDLADELKAERARRPELRVLPGRTIGLIFHKPSTRTRVAFEVGIAELGGMALFLPAAELQLVATAELVMAPLWVWVGVREAPGAATLVGGALIILAILAQALGSRDRLPAR